MPSKLERKWWFIALVCLLAAILTNFLMQHAGLAMPYNAAQWAVYILVFVGLQRAFSLAGWLLFLWLAPARAMS